MSEMDKSAATTSEAPAPPPEPKPKPEPRPVPPPQLGGPRKVILRKNPEAPPVPSPEKEHVRTPRPGGRPPSLDDEMRGGGSLGRQSLKDLDAEIEKEMQEAMGGEDAGAVLAETTRPQQRAPASDGPKKLVGKVLRVHGPDVFVDVPGGRSQGLLPMTQFPDGVPPIGMEVDIVINGYDGANGLLNLSRKGAAETVDWSSVAAGVIVEAFVTGSNKGGLEVQVNGIRGFLPISQIELFRVENIDVYKGQRLKCEVTEADPREKNLVLSRRILLEREREENRERMWAELAEGQVRSGTVRQVKDFGAFIDLGGVDGLLHVSEMSWQRVRNPLDLVQPGQTLKVQVLKIDREARKLSLGLRQLTPSPWDDIDAKYPPGIKVAGKVSRTMDFGAFVELEPAVEGLVHISELANGRVWRVTDVVKPGQDVEVAVLAVDKQQRRISLSIKAALKMKEDAERKDAPSEEEEPEVEEAPLKPRVRLTPLRGGVGEKLEIPQFKPPEEAK